MPQYRRPSPEVTDLINRIRKLVAEQRKFDGATSKQRQEAHTFEIARLQRRLASAVKSELTP
jgi:hypothetical protein